jgi:D-apionolactonase
MRVSSQALTDSERLSLYGTVEPPPMERWLSAGPLEIAVTEVGVRDVRYAGHCILAGISFLLRDEHWGTYPIRIKRFEVDDDATGFSVWIYAECGDGNRILQYSLEIVGRPTELHISATAVPEADIMTSRCGFVALHPGTLSGQALRIVHSDGSICNATFPEAIDPLPVFSRIHSLTWEVAPGLTATCVLGGDDYEMEDQRNWGDASFKTYVRPIRLPYPYRLLKGEPIRQSVTLGLAGEPRLAASPRGSAAVIGVGRETGHRVPRIGVVLECDDSEPERTGDLIAGLAPNVVQFLWDHARAPALPALKPSTAGAQTSLILDALLPDGQSLVPSLELLAEKVAASGLAVEAISVTTESLSRNVPLDAVNGDEMLRRRRDTLLAARNVFPGIAIGAGTRGLFTELNRTRPTPGLADFVSHAFCPTVHDAGDEAVMSTVLSLPAMAFSARQFAAGARHSIGPMSIACRFNPYGPTPTPNPDDVRLCLSESDPRQRGQFGAAWLVSVFAMAASCDIDTVLAGTLTGRLGLMNPAAAGAELMLYPLYHVVRGLARAAGKPLLHIDVPDDRSIAGLGYVDGAARTIWLANTRSVSTSATFGALRSSTISIAVLETASPLAARDPAFLERDEIPFEGPTMELGPFSIVRISINSN